MKSTNTIIAIVMLFIVVLLFLHEMVFYDEIPLPGDIVSRHAINNWISEYSQVNEDIPQWYPHLFSGMPSYGGFIYTPSNPMKLLLDPILFNQGLWYLFYLFLGGIGMFLFLRRIDISILPSLFGGLAFSLSPYYFGLINAGHPAKLYAICYIPWIMLAYRYVTKSASWRGVLFLGLVGALQLWTKHVQIVYYTWMVIVFLFMWDQIRAVINRKWKTKKEGKTILVLFASLSLMALLVLDPYLSIYEFQSHSTRGSPSVLDESEKVDEGAKWDYVTAWSFHPKESVSFLYPYFYGLQNFSSKGLKSAAYWGHMSFTQSTHYLGVLMIILVIPGLWFRKHKIIIPMGVVSILIIITGFGHYFPLMFKPLYQLAPMFDKFRVPSMIYALLPVTLGVVSAQGMENLMNLPERSQNGESSKLVKTMLIILGILSGVSLFLILIGDGLLSTEMFSKAGQEIPKSILVRLKATRLDLFNKGLMLSLLAMGGALAALLLKRNKVVNARLFGMIIIVLFVIDLGIVDMEFLDLKSATSLTRQYKKSDEIRFLKKDKSLYRVLPLDSYNTNWYGFFGISSISGYRPVKLRTYQDLMDGSGLNILSQPNSKVPLSKKNELLKVRKPILDMLNVKYLISGQSLEPFFHKTDNNSNIYENRLVLPRAWIVHNIVSVDSRKESFAATLNPRFNPRKEAVVLGFDDKILEMGGQDKVEIIHYSENEIILKTVSDNGGLLVLSENYYEPGWKAVVDDKETQIYQTNHVLRSITIPKGVHDVKFYYNDKTYLLSRTISRTLLTIIVLLIGITFGVPYLRSAKV